MMLDLNKLGHTGHSDVPRACGVFAVYPAGYAWFMYIRKLACDAPNVVICRATWVGSQNFLGARWVERVVDRSPAKARERMRVRISGRRSGEKAAYVDVLDISCGGRPPRGR